MLHDINRLFSLYAGIIRELAVFSFDRSGPGNKDNITEKSSPLEFRRGADGFLTGSQNLSRIFMCRDLQRIVNRSVSAFEVFHGIDNDRHSTGVTTDTSRRRIAVRPVCGRIEVRPRIIEQLIVLDAVILGGDVVDIVPLTNDVRDRERLGFKNILNPAEHPDGLLPCVSGMWKMNALCHQFLTTIRAKYEIVFMSFGCRRFFKIDDLRRKPSAHRSLCYATDQRTF